jgi:hypothetical protein
MKRTLIYAIAACVFAVATATTTPKAHAAVEIFLTLDGGGGDDGGSASPPHKTTAWEAFEVLLGIID